MASRVSTAKVFPSRILAGFAATKYLPIRAGDHRFINIWVVVVGDRVVVRSWNDKPTGWYRAFLSQPLGSVRIDDRELAVRREIHHQGQCPVREGLQEPKAQSSHVGTG